MALALWPGDTAVLWACQNRSFSAGSAIDAWHLGGAAVEVLASLPEPSHARGCRVAGAPPIGPTLVTAFWSAGRDTGREEQGTPLQLSRAR